MVLVHLYLVIQSMEEYKCNSYSQQQFVLFGYLCSLKLFWCACVFVHVRAWMRVGCSLTVASCAGFVRVLESLEKP